MTLQTVSGADPVNVVPTLVEQGSMHIACSDCVGGQNAAVHHMVDGGREILVAFCWTKRDYKIFCGCSEPFHTEMVMMDAPGVPYSEGVQGELRCPLCNRGVSFTF